MGLQNKERGVTNRVTKMHLFKCSKIEALAVEKIETNRVILGPIGGFVWVGIVGRWYLSGLIRI